MWTDADGALLNFASSIPHRYVPGFSVPNISFTKYHLNIITELLSSFA